MCQTAGHQSTLIILRLNSLHLTPPLWPRVALKWKWENSWVLSSSHFWSILTRKALPVFFILSFLLWMQSPSMRACRGPDCLAQDEAEDEAEDERNCPMERAERRRLAQLTLSNEYIPECRKDGAFAPIQCHPGTKACWCVLLNGKPITGSTVFNKKPNCSKYRKGRKTVMSRRSSAKPRRSWSLSISLKLT